MLVLEPVHTLTLYLQFAGGMNGSESECESLDSGLETTSNSQLEAEAEGGHADPDTEEEEEERHGGGDTGDLSDFRCAVVISTLLYQQGGEGRQTKAENLRSSRAIQSIFSLLGRNGKFFIFVI